MKSRKTNTRKNTTKGRGFDKKYKDNSTEEVLSAEELCEMDPVELYVKIKEGEINKFPDKYWSPIDPEYLSRVKAICDYLFNQELKWKRWELEDKISRQTFKKAKLVGMYDSFNSSTIKLLNSIYDYSFRVNRLTSYSKRLSQIRKDLEWMVKKLIAKKLITTVNAPVDEKIYYDLNVGYILDNKYYKSSVYLSEILLDLHPDLLKKYFTNKGSIRKGVKIDVSK